MNQQQQIGGVYFVGSSRTAGRLAERVEGNVVAARGPHNDWSDIELDWLRRIGRGFKQANVPAVSQQHNGGHVLLIEKRGQKYRARRNTWTTFRSFDSLAAVENYFVNSGR